MSIQELEFRKFIVEAKRAAYASGSHANTSPTRPGAKDLPYRNGAYAYLDSYYGELHFSGQEVVWHEEKAKWSMNYYGTTLDPIAGFPAFLNECLKEVSVDAPYRGPAFRKYEDFEYHCDWSGDWTRFNGEERITYKGKVIFNLFFHGGVVAYL